ncbi:hypothetical protein CCU68_20840 [Pseudomonas gingeri NCPPB 3146 = LMG 5327]|uniref:Uncharacterized protein n=2 Tax=Pseudomonas gingeri TaxID=117681 RepID=A0A7Y8CB94_9PSED|nr:hypothetical protein [Pseudomonas gingeri]NWC12970.1 hypothetical protein [Pseudomonas gingeri]NWE46505.1 hypothetical protein [Pseudomonas gingeri]PNQ90621.1 hypothetical protein CCU68_20840 [Pseudomonas gingeri NCPPB 3146 = LMG 5327]
MDAQKNKLLFGIPEGADYAVEAIDLDAEDIPSSRVDAVRELLRDSTDSWERFLSAKLLAAWGYEEGLISLEAFVDRPESIAGGISQNLHGYDDTFKHILFALSNYYIKCIESGRRDEARLQIFSPISKVVALAGTTPFEVSDIFWLVEREGFVEYVPLFEEYLEKIIDFPDRYRWRIRDVIALLLKVDAEFVSSILRRKGKTLGDFDF